MKNLNKIKYSLLHRKAFELVARQLLKDKDLEEILKRSKVHDMDKVVLYTIMTIQEVHNYHIKTTSHHDNDIPKNYYDYLEMIIDWECAGLTKKDKPLNAYDTLNKYYSHISKEILPILKKLGIDYSYSVNDIYPKVNLNIDQSDIITEINDYLFKE